HGNMILNESGKMIRKWYYELQNKFPDIICQKMIIMPNHFHCIIQNVGNPVGADLCVCPNTCVCPNYIYKHPNIIGNHIINKNGECQIPKNNKMGEQMGEQMGEHIGSPLHCVVQWFKTMTTNEYIRGVKTKQWKPFDGKLWQRNYYEHIIRN